MAGAPESGDRITHKKNAPNLPLSPYFPTPGEFQKLQQDMQTTMNEQKSVFHDGIIPDIGKVMAGMKHTGDQAPGFFHTDLVGLTKTGPKTFKAELLRMDGSTDDATIVNGKVNEEHLVNVMGETTRKYGKDGRLTQEDHRIPASSAQIGDAEPGNTTTDDPAPGHAKSVEAKPQYSDHIEYDKKGKAVKTHIESGDTTIDDNRQADGSWKKQTTIKVADGVETETVVTHRNQSVDKVHTLPNGDYEKISQDPFGAITKLDTRQTDEKTGTTVHRFLDKDGQPQTENLYHI